MANALHARKGDNPHFWYDLSRLDQITAAIQAVYGTQRPEAVMRFTAHVATLNDALKPMFDRALAIRKQYAGAAVAYTERVPGYLLPALSLNNQTPATFASAIEDGNEPSPADQSTMQDTIITKQVRMLLYNSQAKSPVTESVRSLAEHSGIPVVTVTETLPANMTYQVWMEGQLDAIRAALDNTK
jgi:zinc/manganese transport system substrate-binding protein